MLWTVMPRPPTISAVMIDYLDQTCVNQLLLLTQPAHLQRAKHLGTQRLFRFPLSQFAQLFGGLGVLLFQRTRNIDAQHTRGIESPQFRTCLGRSGGYLACIAREAGIQSGAAFGRAAWRRRGPPTRTGS